MTWEGDVCGGLQVVYSKEDTLQTQRRTWKFFQQYNVASFVVGSCVVAVFGLSTIGMTPRVNGKEAHAKTFTTCSITDHTRLVDDEVWESASARAGMSLNARVTHRQSAGYGVTYNNQQACSHVQTANSTYNADTSDKAMDTLAVPGDQAASDAPARLARPAVPFVPERRVLPLISLAHSMSTTLASPDTLANALSAVGRAGNMFPYGQCTWWANQRYYQVHNVFVPWTSNANAGQWIYRAREFGWRVSTAPIPGSILVLEPGVEGASWLGHVAFVEQVLADGSVIASSMNWGAYPAMVTEAQFSPGPGVAFVSR